MEKTPAQLSIRRTSLWGTICNVAYYVRTGNKLTDNAAGAVL